VRQIYCFSIKQANYFTENNIFVNKFLFSVLAHQSLLPLLSEFKVCGFLTQWVYP